jgi:hypothetical protein
LSAALDIWDLARLDKGIFQPFDAAFDPNASNPLAFAERWAQPEL